MTGNVMNGRPGPSEATRYTYLHFGGLGVSFNAKQDHQFVGLKQAGGSTDEQQMKLMADTKPGDEAAPFFSEDGGKEADLKYSLCYPFRRPRYWYSGPDADEEKVVYVYNTSPSTSKVMYRGEPIYTSFSAQVLSAAIFDDPLEGECLFVVSVSSRYESYYASGGYVELVLGFPITGTVIRVKNKAQVRTWTKRASDYPDEPPFYGSEFELMGCHTLDGAKFIHVLHALNPEQNSIIDRVFSIDSQGEISLEQEAPMEHEVKSNVLTSSESRGNSSSPPDPEPWESYSTVGSYSSQSSRNIDHTGSSIRRREILHDGETLDIEKEGRTANTQVISVNYSSTLDKTRQVVPNPNTGPGNYPFIETASDSVSSGSKVSSFESSTVRTYRVKLWDGMGIAVYHEQSSNSTTQSSDWEGTSHVDIAYPHDLWISESTENYSYTSVITHEETRRVIEAWCVHSKSVWVRCSSEKITTTAKRSGTESYVDTHLGSAPRLEENDTEVVSETTKRVWMELLVGDQLTMFEEISLEPVKTTTTVPPGRKVAEGWDLDIAVFIDGPNGSWAESWEDSLSPLVTIDWPITTSTVVSGNWYDWAVNGMFAAKNAHMIGLNGKAIIAVPRYYYGTNYPTEAVTEVKSVPDPGKWLVRIAPSEAEVGAASELSSHPESFTFVSTVYPTE